MKSLDQLVNPTTRKEYSTEQMVAQLENDRSFILAFYQGGMCNPETNMHLVNRTINEFRSIDPDNVPKSMQQKAKDLKQTLMEVCKLTSQLVRSMIALGQFVVANSIEDADHPETLDARTNITSTTKDCNAQVRRCWNALRLFAYGEAELDWLDPKLIKKEEGDPRDLSKADDERMMKEEEEDQKRRRKRKKESQENIEKEQKQKQERRRRLEAYMQRLAAMTLLQARRILAATLGLNSRYFDRYSKDDLEQYAQTELDDGLSPDRMRDLLAGEGLPQAWLFSKNKEQLRGLCTMAGFNVD
uniref:Uncharacterized protein n=1 Tax=Lotharella oceanica TaxID=641309 RepID=A0A7S2XCF0_9EUKA